MNSLLWYVDIQCIGCKNCLLFHKYMSMFCVYRSIYMYTFSVVCISQGARPPLHVATASDMPDIIRLLLSHGADPTKQDEVCSVHNNVVGALIHCCVNLIQQGVMAFEIAEMRNLADLAKRLNPQQV